MSAALTRACSIVICHLCMCAVAAVLTVPGITRTKSVVMHVLESGVAYVHSIGHAVKCKQSCDG